MESDWVSTKQFAEGLGLSIPELEIKLLSVSLLTGENNHPTEKAFSGKYAKIVRTGLLRRKTTLWNSRKIIALLNNRRYLDVEKEGYIRQAVGILTQIYTLSRNDFIDRARKLGEAFWERVPSLLRPEVKILASIAFQQQLPNISSQLLLQARQESEGSGNILEVTPFRKEGKEQLLREIEDSCSDEAMVTLNVSYQESFNITVKRLPQAGSYIWGDAPEDKLRFLELLDYGVILVVHIVGNEIDPKSGQKILIVKGFQIGSNARNFFYKKIPPDLLKENYETEPSGRRNPPDSRVRYD